MLADPLAWVIDLNGFYIGGVWLFSVDDHDKRASLRLGINDPSKLGKGLGTESICLVLQYGFTVLDLHRVSVRVLDFNKRAIRSYQKCGFKIEGREREAALIDGKRYDDIMMGILRPDFQASSMVAAHRL